MQLRAICKSKIHHATVTEANVNYIGSIAIDTDLLERVDIIPGEKVAVWNVNNGERIETYALPAPAGSGSILVNGAAARRFQPGDKVIIVSGFGNLPDPMMRRDLNSWPAMMSGSLLTAMLETTPRTARSKKRFPPGSAVRNGRGPSPGLSRFPTPA